MTARRTGTTAAATALAFALGTLVIPTLHLLFHALPHDHDGGAIHYHLPPDEDHGHDHAAGEDHEHPPEAHEHHEPDREHEPFEPQHGEGTAAHFSLALSDAPATTIDVVLFGFAEQGRVAPASDSFHAPARADARRYRGPPVAG